MSDKIPFMPVLGSAESVAAQQPRDGYIYFTTDTRQIFVAKDGKMVEECGGLRLFYGNKDIEYDNSGLLPDPNVSFLYGELEETSDLIPMVNDLILNKDGCFYRVGTVLDDLIQTTRLTLQGTGTGGGSGSGGGGGDTTGGTFSLKVNGVADKVYSSNTDKMLVPFISYYSGTDDNYIDQVAFYFTGKEDSPFYFKSDLHLAFNEVHNIDLIECLDQFDVASKKKVYIAVYDKYGNTRSTFFSIQIVELGITASTNEIFSVNKGDDANYVFTLTGGASGLTNRKLIYNIYNEGNTIIPIYTGESEITGTSTTIQKKLNLNNLIHGSYLLETKVTAGIIGSSEQLSSNVLTHKLVYFDAVDGNPILSILLPTTLEQYTSIPMKYLLTAKETGTYTLVIKLDGKEKDRISITSNDDIKSYNLYFEQAGSYVLEAQVAEVGYTYQTTMIITAYSGNLPVIDPANESLMLYLTPRGKSNDSQTKNKWADYNGKYTAKLHNLYYGSVNGWLTDKQQTPYLLLSSGAKLTLDEFRPFQYDPTKTASNNSKMGYGMTIEIDFEINGVTDYDEPIIKCLSTNEAGTILVGFQITGNSMKMYNSRGKEALSSVSIVEGKRIRATFVIEPQKSNDSNYPLCLTYINGAISGAVIYTKNTDAFKDGSNPATLNIDATNAQVKIYGIRFYSTALSDADILNNYTASLPTLEERQRKFDSNNIFDERTNKVSYKKVSAEDYDLQIPYMVFRGGYPTEKESKWQLSTTERKPGLPSGKKTYKMVDVEIHYPKNAYFSNYKDYFFTNEFAGGATMATASGQKPTNGGCIIYGQGTSSMEYPIKNLRVRVKNEEDKITVRPDIAPVEIICMKADYMDSSGSHNTGTGNLVDAGLEKLNMKTPGQEHFGGGDKTIVTCIKGYPCLIFYDNGTNGEEYEYIGKYNMNLDKATPEPFGFDHDDSDFGYLSVGDEYYELAADGKTEVLKTVKEGEKINSIHCFEFLDNSINVCNFQKRKGDRTYYDTWYTGKTWTEGFESRYPEDVENSHGADSLYPLANWINELQELREKEESEGKIVEETIVYEYSPASKFDENAQYFTLKDDGTYEEAFIESKEELAAGTYYTRAIKEKRFTMDSLERFRREYECYLDKNFLLYYYCITESLLLVDSRVKNMMIATWGKDKRKYKDLDGVEHETNNYIFYPIFYDMDTALGLDNAGLPKFDYYVDEETSSDIYNGRYFLWNFVKDALKEEVNAFYNRMESANIVTAEGILPYYNDNQAEVANEAMYNGDARYKYISPAVDGYYDGLNEKDILPGEAPYLYAAQGPRTLTRTYFVNNRVPYIRGKRQSKNFQERDTINFRWNYPKDESDEKLGQSIKVVKPDGKFNFTSLQTCFAGVKLGRNSTVLYTKRFDGEESAEINVLNAENANGTEAYLLGVSNLKSVGDLSNKYIQKFQMMADNNKLEELILGNPYQFYRNSYWGATGAEIALSNCTYLKYFNLQNCQDFAKTLDFSSCPYIEKILLTGSSTTSAKFPANGSIKELRLPATINSFMINSHALLTDENFTIGNWIYESAEELKYIGKDGHYENDFSQLRTISVVNTPISVHEMIKNAPMLDSYCVQGFNWVLDDPNESFYCRPEETEAQGGKTYYKYNAESQRYEVTTDYTDWSKIREKVALVENGKVTRIPILEFLKTRSPEMDGQSIDQKDALVGTITINVAATVNEYDIYNKYRGIYPNLVIEYGDNATVDKAYTVKFYAIDNYESITPETKTHYEVLTDGKTDLATLVSVSGPNGAAMIAPVKSSTPTQIFTFTGSWMAYYNNTSEVWSQADFASKVPSGYNYVLVPIYQEAVREYLIQYYQDDDTLITECRYHYGDIPANNSDTPLLAYKSEAELGPTERYNFEGWISEIDHKNKVSSPEFYDLDTMMVNYDGLKMYAHYVVKDCTKVPMDLKYFDISRKDLILYRLTFNEQYQQFNSEGEIYKNIPNVYTIAIKQKYWKYFKGRFTYPSYDADGHELIAITDQHTAASQDEPQISEVYFLESAKYTTIYTEAFYNWKSLTKIDLPNTIRYIGTRCFENCEQLVDLKLNDNIEVIGSGAFASTNNLWFSSLPSKLQVLNTRAFVNSGISHQMKEGDRKISNLPPTIIALGTNTFMNCPYIILKHIGTDNDTGVPYGYENALKYLDSNCLAGGNSRGEEYASYYPSEPEENPTLYIHSSVSYLFYEERQGENGDGSTYHIKESCFKYGNSGLLAENSGITLHSKTAKINDSNYADYFGEGRVKGINTSNGG